MNGARLGNDEQIGAERLNLRLAAAVFGPRIGGDAVDNDLGESIVIS